MDKDVLKKRLMASCEALQHGNVCRKTPLVRNTVLFVRHSLKPATGW